MLTNIVYRRWKSTSFLSLTPISSNDYASIIWTWRLGETFSFSTEELKQNSIYELTVLLTQFHFLVNDDLVSSVLASICTRIEKGCVVLPLDSGFVRRRKMNLAARKTKSTQEAREESFLLQRFPLFLAA